MIARARTPHARAPWWPTAAAAASPSVVFLAAPEPPCAQSAGIFVGITRSGQRIEQADRRDLSVERAGTANAGRSGMPLCFGDIVVTGPVVTATLLLDGESDPNVTLFPNTTTELVDSSSILLRLGRLFVSLHGKFDVRTVFARLGARGTQFEVGVTPERLDVVQLEGTLEVTPEPMGAAATWPVEDATQAAGWPTAGPWLFEVARVEQATSVKLGRLTRFEVARGEPQTLSVVDEKLVRGIVGANSAAVSATHPAVPSQNLISVFDSVERRTAAYREARFQTIWAPEKREFFRQLGDVHADWAEGAEAVRAYDQGPAIAGTGRELAITYNRLGNVRRLAGDLNAAEELYRKALSADALFAFPYNGIGDVLRDRSLAALDRQERVPAYELALKARDAYEKSLDPGLWGKEQGPNRAVALVNLGQILLQLGDLTASDPGQKDFTRARQYLADADKRFQEALGEGGEAPFPLVGRGRVLAAEARVYDAQKQTDQARQALARAQAQLETAIKRFPTFAVAHQWLGAVFEQGGQPDRAIPMHMRATQLDPQYATAYFRLATTLERTGQVDQARQYYQAYRRVESPIFRGGNRLAIANKIAPGGTPAPALVGLSRSNAEKAIRNAGFIVGTVKVQPSQAKRDTVLEQSVAAQAPATRGSAIDLVIAGPLPQPVKVPNVVGRERDSAVKDINSRGLTVGEIREQPSCESVGRVLSQSPSSNAQVPPQSSVTIVVAALGPSPGRVPDVSRLSENEAVRRIQDAGLTVGRVNTVETDSVDSGSVSRQDPRAGTPLARNCSVALTVAKPTPKVPVPDFVGKSIEDVRKQLPAGFRALLSDFSLGTVTEEADERKAGTVIRQDPAPQTPVPRRSATPINFVVARGGGGQGAPPDSLVTVPPIKGRSLRDAISMLKEAGLGCYVPSGESGGYVADSSPAPGAHVKRGTRVQLKLMIGVAATQSPSNQAASPPQTGCS